MPAKNILVVAIDGLRASALGAYGNTSFPTPALDQFASESFLLDACFAPSADLSLIYRALWQSLDPLRGDRFAAVSAAPLLPVLLRGLGYSSALVTDCASVPAMPLATAFDDCIQIFEPASERAEVIDQTAVSHLFSACADAIQQRGDSPHLLWIHSSGMYGPWDAPVKLQRSLLDDEDPSPLESIEPPDLTIRDTDDPDTTFRHACAYAAQIVALDAAWDLLMQALNADRHGDWLVMLVGVRGMPLGEHRRIGGVDDRLHADQLHVPWLIRFPDGVGRILRSGSLTSHADLPPTIMDWLRDNGFQLQLNQEPLDGKSVLSLLREPWSPERDALLASSPNGTLAIRTPGWTLLQPLNVRRREDGADTSEEIEPNRATELYVRPDDRWEANDIAGLCPEVVEGLGQIAANAADQIQQGQPVSRNALPVELRSHKG